MISYKFRNFADDGGSVCSTTSSPPLSPMSPSPSLTSSNDGGKFLFILNVLSITKFRLICPWHLEYQHGAQVKSGSHSRSSIFHGLIDWERPRLPSPHLLPFIVRAKNIRLNLLFTLIKWHACKEKFSNFRNSNETFPRALLACTRSKQKMIKDPPTYRAGHQVWWTVKAIPTLIKNVFPHLLRFVSHRAVGHGRWRSMW